jgi:hypothetical protein
MELLQGRQLNEPIVDKVTYETVFHGWMSNKILISFHFCNNLELLERHLVIKYAQNCMTGQTNNLKVFESKKTK